MVLTYVCISEDVDSIHLNQAVNLYREVFAREPYFESFEPEEVVAILTKLAREGNLVFAISDGEVVGLIGGYELTSEVSYYIDEFAVSVSCQGQGIGTRLFKFFMDLIAEKYRRLVIRTLHNNVVALRMYRKFGFVPTQRTEWVPCRNPNGVITLDKRVYLVNDFQLASVTIASPSGNVTAMVFDDDTGYDRKYLQSQLSKIWDQKYPDKVVEQCCFVTAPHTIGPIGRVEMFGGEFCGNAARSAIWAITKGIDSSGTIEVSGVSNPLNFTVKDSSVMVTMPIPSTPFITEVPEGLLVRLDGITHLVQFLEDETSHRHPVTEDHFHHLRQNNVYGFGELPAVGVCVYNVATQSATFKVWVKSVETLFDETACGSGTCAIGCAKAFIDKTSIHGMKVGQPSGEYIEVDVDYNNTDILSASIRGAVDILHQGSFSLK